MTASFFQCPYADCMKWNGGAGKRVPRNVGKYRIKIIDGGHILIFNCMCCGKSFRVSMLGVPLLWADMSPYERNMAKKKQNNIKK